ncbi:hypothetical protein Btru_064921 [Bulinus truncatus]|nr:hypothetical protein Btru_064921 [Bulinus truncatus]
MSVNNCGFVSPFSAATVVIADNYVDSFPSPKGLIIYLQRLFLKLNIDVLSSDRPLTIKGSWQTVVKIDAFLNTLITTLQTSFSEGFEPSESDFNAAFKNFELENNYWNDAVHSTQPKANDEEIKKFAGNRFSQTTKNENSPDPSLLSTINLENKNSSSPEIIQPILNKRPLDKWYFNANLRGKTINKTRYQFSNSIQSPPEPFVIVEEEEASKNNQPSIKEIEEALCQVYKKETIEKYQKKLPNSDSGEVGFTPKQDLDSNCIIKEEVVEYNKKPFSHNGVDAEACLVALPSQSANQIESQKTNIKKTKKKGKKINKSHKRKKRSSTLCDIKSENSAKSDIIKTFEKKQVIGSRHSLRQLLKKCSLPSKLSITDNGLINSEVEIQDRNFQKCVKLKTSIRSFTQKTITKKSGCKYKKIERDRTVKHEDSGIENTEISMNDIKSQATIQFLKQENTTTNNKLQSNQVTEKHDEMSILIYKCENCLYETSKEIQLVEHKRRVHLTKKFTCEICFKEFGYHKDLRRHIKCHTKAENCCDICGKLYKEVRKLVEHKKIHAEDYIKPEFPCKFCSKSFSTKYVLAYHIKSNHLGMRRSYICPTCGKSFSQKNSYLQHANVHLGIRPYVCEVCGNKFSYEKSLKEHMFMHKTDKSFPCKMCNKSFRQASGLTIHMRIHKATKDYVCSMCGKGFSQRQAMVRHERIHAGEKPFECILCKRTFADSSVLRRHMILIHKKDPKMWREDTVCHIQRKKDFFINIINGSSKTKTSESHEVGQEPNEEVQHQNLAGDLTDRTQHLYVPDHDIQFSEFQRDVEHYITDSIASKLAEANTDTHVKEEPLHANLQDSRTLTEQYGNADNNIIVSPNVQAQVFPPPEHVCVVNPSPQLDTSLYSSLPFTLQGSIVPHQVQGIIPTRTQSVDHVPVQQMAQQNLASHTQNTFVPMEYSQRQFSYDSDDIHQVHYASLVSQPFTQTIVVLQDNLGSVTYNRPNLVSILPNPYISWVLIERP